MTTEPTTQRSATHVTFAIERRYKQPPARVFAAFAEREAKRRWFTSSAEITTEEYTLDFRVGGRETWRGRHSGSPDAARNETMFRDIVPEERIICVYDMWIGSSKISVSLLTLEFKPAGAGTLLVLTEQDVFLDGYVDGGGREHGTREMLDALEAELNR
jgi:uncharacterized protein YndB with AHSA1/START domain